MVEYKEQTDLKEANKLLESAIYFLNRLEKENNMRINTLYDIEQVVKKSKIDLEAEMKSGKYYED